MNDLIPALMKGRSEVVVYGSNTEQEVVGRIGRVGGGGRFGSIRSLPASFWCRSELCKHLHPKPTVPSISVRTPRISRRQRLQSET